MYKAKIKLIYKQVIDAHSKSAFERAIIQASYQEFRLKSQAYNQDARFQTFSQMKANDGRANSLHYKLSFSVLHFIEQLNNKIPVLKDNLGNKLAFETAAFELIESHTQDMLLHKVAINYQTETVTLIDFMGDYLLLTKDDLADSEPVNTFVVKMQPDLSIMTYQEINQFAVANRQLTVVSGQ
jgi:hypothetical protein